MTQDTAPTPIDAATAALGRAFWWPVGIVLALAVVIAIVSAVLTVIVWNKGNTLQELMQADADTRISEARNAASQADARVAEANSAAATANAVAAKANAEAAKANESLATANLEIERQKNEGLQLTQDVEAERTKRIQLELELTTEKAKTTETTVGRTVTGTVRQQIVKYLKNVAPGDILILPATPDDDSAQTEEVIAIFKEVGGWNFLPSQGIQKISWDGGLRVTAPQTESRDFKTAQAIASAFSGSGIHAVAATNPARQHLTIIVGPGLDPKTLQSNNMLLTPEPPPAQK